MIPRPSSIGYRFLGFYNHTGAWCRELDVGCRLVECLVRYLSAWSLWLMTQNTSCLGLYVYNFLLVSLRIFGVQELLLLGHQAMGGDAIYLFQWWKLCDLERVRVEWSVVDCDFYWYLQHGECCWGSICVYIYNIYVYIGTYRMYTYCRKHVHILHMYSPVQSLAQELLPLGLRARVGVGCNPPWFSPIRSVAHSRWHTDSHVSLPTWMSGESQHFDAPMKGRVSQAFSFSLSTHHCLQNVSAEEACTQLSHWIKVCSKSAVPKRLRALTEGALRPAARFNKSLKGTLFTSSSVTIPLESRTQWFHVVLVLPEYCCAPVCCSLIGGIPYQQEGIPDSFKHPKLLAKVSSWPTIAWVEDDKQIDSWVLAKIPIWTFTSAAFVLQVVLSTGFRLAEPFPPCRTISRSS